MISNLGRTLAPLTLLFGFLSIASTAQAQGNTFNPYGNSGYADYREFGNAMYSNNPALPGQALLNNSPTISRPRANSYQQYSNESDGAETDPATYRRGSSNLPYFQAYQRLNAQNNRVYQPNNTPEDRKFYERQKQRDQDYAKAQEERDPIKRSKLLRQVDRNSLDRPSTSPRNNVAKATLAPKPNLNSTSPTARTSAPNERRTPAPSPFPSMNSRRLPSNGSITRPPTAARSGSTENATTRSGPANRATLDPSIIPVPSPR